MRTSSVILAIAVLGAAAGTAGAQGHSRNRTNDNVRPAIGRRQGCAASGSTAFHRVTSRPRRTARRRFATNRPTLESSGVTTPNQRDRNVYDARNDRGDRRDFRDYPRDANGNPYDPTCVDNDRDGWCDYHTGRSLRRSDRRYHASRLPGEPRRVPWRQRWISWQQRRRDRQSGPYPSQMPAMTGASLMRVGVRTVDVQDWLGRGSLRDRRRWTQTATACRKSRRGTIATARSCRCGATIIATVARTTVEIYQNGQRVQVVR